MQMKCWKQEAVSRRDQVLGPRDRPGLHAAESQRSPALAMSSCGLTISPHYIKSPEPITASGKLKEPVVNFPQETRATPSSQP